MFEFITFIHHKGEKANILAEVRTTKRQNPWTEYLFFNVLFKRLFTLPFAILVNVNTVNAYWSLQIYDRRELSESSGIANFNCKCGKRDTYKFSLEIYYCEWKAVPREYFMQDGITNSCEFAICCRKLECRLGRVVWKTGKVELSRSFGISSAGKTG